MRKCPACKSKISLWQIAKPGISKQASPVICNSCNKIISNPWKEYYWVVAFGFPLGFLTDSLVNNLCDCSFLISISITLIVIFLYCFFLLLIFPLKEQNITIPLSNENENNEFTSNSESHDYLYSVKFKRIIRNVLSIIIAVFIYIESSSFISAICFLIAEEILFNEAKLKKIFRYSISGTLFIISIASYLYFKYQI